MENVLFRDCPHEGGTSWESDVGAGYDGRLGFPNCNVFVQRTCRKRMSHRHQDYSANDGKITTNVSVSGCDEYFAGDDDPAENNMNGI